MNIYSKKIRWKFLLLLLAIGIGAASLYYTRVLVNKLSLEEKKKIELWAEATRRISDLTNTNDDPGFLLKVLENNQTIPVILTNHNDSIIQIRNISEEKIKNRRYAEKLVRSMKEQGNIIEILLPGNKRQYILYDKSLILTKLTYYPLIQLGVIILFILVAYMAFSASRNAEQTQVWVGLSKETAHQLGTPTSSLMAWLEILRQSNVNENSVKELEKDVYRLKKITDRFSKIGSKPKLAATNVIQVIQNAVDYIKTRSSDRVAINLVTSENDITIPLNEELFEWVIENICKNAIDAMEGNGTINIKITDNTQVMYIDITDTGKGIPKSKFNTIFKPGYTTKERGWGLGLSLSERIVQNYHDGKIFVHYSELGKGTRFRIVLKKFF